MGKSLLYILFRLGKLPKTMADTLNQEGIVLLDEGIPGSVSLRKFRAPGRFHSYKHIFFAGSIVVTELRFAAFAFSRPLINVLLGDSRMNRLDISVDGHEALEVTFDAGVFHEGWKGTAKCRFNSPNARLFFERLSLSVGSMRPAIR